MRHISAHNATVRLEIL